MSFLAIDELHKCLEAMEGKLEALSSREENLKERKNEIKKAHAYFRSIYNSMPNSFERTLRMDL